MAAFLGITCAGQVEAIGFYTNHGATSHEARVLENSRGCRISRERLADGSPLQWVIAHNGTPLYTAESEASLPPVVGWRECEGMSPPPTVCSSDLEQVVAEAVVVGLKEQGNARIAEHDNDGAIQLYAQAITLASKLPQDAPVVADLYSNRAEAGLRARSWEAALTDALEAIRRKPDHTKALLRAAVAAMHLKRLGEAKRLLDRSLKVNPYNPEAQQLALDLAHAAERALAKKNGGFGRQVSGFGRQTSGFGRQTSGFGRQTSGFGRQTSALDADGSFFGRQTSAMTAVTALAALSDEEDELTRPRFSHLGEDRDLHDIDEMPPEQGGAAAPSLLMEKFLKSSCSFDEPMHLDQLGEKLVVRWMLPSRVADEEVHVTSSRNGKKLKVASCGCVIFKGNLFDAILPDDLKWSVSDGHELELVMKKADAGVTWKQFWAARHGVDAADVVEGVHHDDQFHTTAVLAE
mmetsp:Transcript_128146/g.371003  ORF Transcript_128146/g.371003 Transcript_128146/m.371003 type:complete len:464 (-) Transcript_128146:289-1680(-)